MADDDAGELVAGRGGGGGGRRDEKERGEGAHHGDYVHGLSVIGEVVTNSVTH